MIAAIGKHQIVFDPPGIIGEKPVALTPLPEVQHIHGHQCFEPKSRRREIRAAQDHLPHMAHVKEPRLAARVLMLPHHAERILYRHLISGEGHHLRPKL